MSKRGVLVATVLLILSTVSAHYYDIVDLPLLPSDFKANPSNKADFEISAHPNTIILKNWSGSSNGTTIILEANKNFQTNVTLIIGPAKANFFGIMDNVQITLSSHHIFLPPNGREQSTLTIEVKSFISPGKYDIEVIGVASKIKHSVHINLIVTS